MNPPMHFKVYQGKDGDWFWRLISANGRIIADSAEGYGQRQDAIDGIELVRQACLTNAPTVVDP